MFRQFNKPVSKEFRETVKRCYPGLGDNEFFWRLTQHLMLTGTAEEDGSGYVTSREAVWAFAGKKRHDRSADSLIKEYSEASGIEIEVSDYNVSKGKARCISAKFVPEVMEALEKELDTVGKEKGERVFFATGAPTSRRKLKRELAEHDNYLLNLAREIDENHPAKELMDYLCTQDYQGKLLSRNMPAALKKIYSDFTGERQTYSMKVLSAAEESPTVRYHATDHSHRLFATGQSLLALPREIRDVALAGCHKFDLVCAHLAISAKLWNLKQTTMFLAARNKPWSELAGYLQVDLKAAKPTLKVALYALCYGCSKSNLKTIVAYGDNSKKTM